MKKNRLISLAMALILVLSLTPALVFAAANTPISSIDLAGLNLGAGWAGETVGTVKADISGYSGFASQNISFVMGVFADSNLNFLSDTDRFSAGDSYMIQLVLKADDGFYFQNNKGAGTPADYLGTVDPAPTTSFLGSYMIGESIGCPADATFDQMVYMVLVYRIEVKGHVHEKGTHHDAVAPTCEAGGTVEYWDCSGCDKKLNADCEEIDDIKNGDPLGHSFDTANWQTSETEHWHAATCGHTEEKDSVGSHEDSDKDHKCDICGRVLSECTDENKDHKCDVCGKALSECTDENKDHKCDVCGKELSKCTDENKDHKCDVCGKDLGAPLTGNTRRMAFFGCLLLLAIIGSAAVVIFKKQVE